MKERKYIKDRWLNKFHNEIAIKCKGHWFVYRFSKDVGTETTKCLKCKRETVISGGYCYKCWETMSRCEKCGYPNEDGRCLCDAK